MLLLPYSREASSLEMCSMIDAGDVYVLKIHYQNKNSRISRYWRATCSLCRNIREKIFRISLFLVAT